MKHRNVKVAVYPARCKPGNRNVPLPNQALMKQKLDEIFGYQVNAWFEITYKPQVDYDYDLDSDGVATAFSTEIQAMVAGNHGFRHSDSHDRFR